MGIFDRFKKKKPHYDSTNIRVQDLDVGFIFEYDMREWQVEAIYEYDWGDNFFSREFKITDGNQTQYLSMSEDDDLELSIAKKIKVHQLSTSLHEKLHRDQNPGSTISYDSKNFFLESSSSGYFHDIARGDNWEELKSWDFEHDDGPEIITIEQWDDDEFEASIGLVVKEFEISNILPSS